MGHVNLFYDLLYLYSVNSTDAIKKIIYFSAIKFTSKYLLNLTFINFHFLFLEIILCISEKHFYPIIYILFSICYSTQNCTIDISNGIK